MPADRLVAAALGLTLLGGVGVAVDTYATIPAVVGAVSFLAMVVGLLLAGVFGFRSARRTGHGFARSLWRGLRTLWSWFWHFAP